MLSLILPAALAIALLTGCGRTPESDAQRKAEAETDKATPPTRSSYSVQWVSNDVPATMTRDRAVEVKISAKNTGDWTWRDPFTAHPSRPDGRHAVRLTYRWMDQDGGLLPQGSARAELLKALPAGETATFTLLVTPPSEPGRYQLQFDLVEELVAFFSAHGAEKLAVPVVVE